MTPSHEQIVDRLRQILAAIPEGEVLAEIRMTDGTHIAATIGPMGMPPYGQGWSIETFGPLAAGAIGPGKPDCLIPMARKSWIVRRKDGGGVHLELVAFSALNY